MKAAEMYWVIRKPMPPELLPQHRKPAARSVNDIVEKSEVAWLQCFRVKKWSRCRLDELPWPLVMAHVVPILRHDEVKLKSRLAVQSERLQSAKEIDICSGPMGALC